MHRDIMQYNYFATSCVNVCLFQYSRAIGQYWAEAARYLADSTLIPFNASQYGETLKVFVSDLKQGYGDLMDNNGVTLGTAEH